MKSSCLSPEGVSLNVGSCSIWTVEPLTKPPLLPCCGRAGAGTTLGRGAAFGAEPGVAAAGLAASLAAGLAAGVAAAF